MTKELTNRQRAVLNFVIECVRSKGYPPSIREMMAAFDIKSLRGVTVHLGALERKGFIKRERTSRSIKVLRPVKSGGDDTYVRLPLVGTIAAGEPILAVENIEGELPVPSALLRGTEGAFLLRVRGDSMVGAHVLDGDLVVIKPQPTAENGDLVAALIGDEATVKRLRLEHGHATLVPANPAYRPIPLREGEGRLIGTVIALIRAY